MARKAPLKLVLGSSGSLHGIAEVIDAFYMGEKFELVELTPGVWAIHKSGRRLEPIVVQWGKKFLFGKP